MKHVAYFVTFSERQSIEAEDASAEVIMDNCIRCHKQLNQEFVNTGRIDYMEAKRGEGKACWDCHRDVAHMNKKLTLKRTKCRVRRTNATFSSTALAAESVGKRMRIQQKQEQEIRK